MSPMHSHSYDHTILQYHRDDTCTYQTWLPYLILEVHYSTPRYQNTSHFSMTALTGNHERRTTSTLNVREVHPIWYIISMRDNLATHHHINSYYTIYVHSMDPVCTNWEISPASAYVTSPWQLGVGVYRLCTTMSWLYNAVLWNNVQCCPVGCHGVTWISTVQHTHTFSEGLGKG